LGGIRDYLAEYEDGKMTARGRVFCENLAIYEALLEHGPLDTVRLRRESRMSATETQFPRAPNRGSIERWSSCRWG